MASNYTENYGLCQWEATDQVLREEFNQDNAAVDEALKGTADLAQAAQALAQAAYSPENSPIAVGSYTGNGAAKRKIELGFTPKAVLVFPFDSKLCSANGTSHTYYHGGLAVMGCNASFYEQGIHSWDNTCSLVGITDNGFWVNEYTGTYSSCRTNSSSTTYFYLAVK